MEIRKQQQIKHNPKGITNEESVSHNIENFVIL